MNCKKTISEVDSYVDGEMSRDSVVRFENHVTHCAECAKALANVLSLSAKLRSSEYRPPLDLKESVRRRMTSPSTKPVGNWENIMKTFARTRWGLTAVAAGLLLSIGFVLVPGRAMAGSAKETWKKMQTATAQVSTVHIQNYWQQDGKKGKTEIWADDHRVRFESPGQVTIFKDGDCQTYETGIWTEEPPSGGGIVGTLSPADFNVSEQIKRLQVYGGSIVSYPDKVVNGSKLKVVGLENDPRGIRFKFLVEPRTGLPVRKIDEEKKDGAWREISHQDFEFNVTLKDQLFVAHPNSK